MKNKIKDHYIDYLLENGKEPESIFKFTKKLKIKESEFYENYNSFKQINSDIWKGYFEETIEQIQKEEVYEKYTVREKLLSFFYTLIEVLKHNRSMVLKSYESLDKPINMKKNPDFADSRRVFTEFMNNLLIEGQETREVEQRPIPGLVSKYPDWVWMLVLSTIDFWINDDSKLFEKTDTLIEKSVNTTMDWMARTPFDSLFDLGKFLFQNKKK
jgi:Tetracyclin repressor-like, C-terminal domain